MYGIIRLRYVEAALLLLLTMIDILPLLLWGVVLLKHPALPTDLIRNRLIPGVLLFRHYLGFRFSYTPTNASLRHHNIVVLIELDGLIMHGTDVQQCVRGVLLQDPLHLIPLFGTHAWLIPNQGAF